jgi:hypothetical protein
MTDPQPLNTRFPPENLEMAVISAIKQSLKGCWPKLRSDLMEKKRSAHGD